MQRVSCRAEVTFRKLLDCPDESDAIDIAKARMRQAAMRIASELKDEGYRVELEIHYLVAYQEDTNG